MNSLFIYNTFHLVFRWSSSCSAVTCVQPCWNQNPLTLTEYHLCIWLLRTGTLKSYGLHNLWFYCFSHHNFLHINCHSRRMTLTDLLCVFWCTFSNVIIFMCCINWQQWNLKSPLFTLWFMLPAAALKISLELNKQGQNCTSSVWTVN